MVVSTRYYAVIILQRALKELNILPDDLFGDAEPLPLLARGDGDRLSFPAGLMEVSR